MKIIDLNYYIIVDNFIQKSTAFWFCFFRLFLQRISIL